MFRALPRLEGNIAAAHEIPQRGGNAVVNGPRVLEPRLPFCGVDVEIRQGGVHIDVHRAHRVGSVGEPALGAVLQRLDHGVVLNPSAVGKYVLVPPVVPE